MTEDIPTLLDRNASCPICRKFYHNIDVHNNPVPSKKNKRTEAELCQCPKGEDARAYRRAYRQEKLRETQEREAEAMDFLAMERHTTAFWEDKRAKQQDREKEVREKNGITTTS